MSAKRKEWQLPEKNAARETPSLILRPPKQTMLLGMMVYDVCHGVSLFIRRQWKKLLCFGQTSPETLCVLTRAPCRKAPALTLSNDCSHDALCQLNLLPKMATALSKVPSTGPSAEPHSVPTRLTVHTLQKVETFLIGRFCDRLSSSL